MKLREAGLLVLAGLAGSLLAGSLLTVPASAAAATVAVDSGDALETVADAFRAAYPGMSPAAAATAAAEQPRRDALRAGLARDAAAYGGAWFDAPAGMLHVAVTTPAAAATAAELSRDLGVRLQTHMVSRSLGELERLADDVRHDTGSLATAAAGNVGIDLKANRVVVALSARQPSVLSWTAPRDGVMVVARAERSVSRDVCTSRADCNDSLRAGLMVTPVCSLGWMAHAKADPTTRFMLTAGHCSTGIGVLWSTAGTPIGTLTGATDRGNIDMATITVFNEEYKKDTVGRIYAHTATDRFVRLNGSLTALANLIEGDTACLAANVTLPAGGNHCGVVGAVSDATVLGLVRVDGYDACGGDSGGGWYQLTAAGNRIALGIHSRSDSGCQIEDGHSWFSPITAFSGTVTIDI